MQVDDDGDGEYEYFYSLEDFEEIWQYGTNETEDLEWEQDGVAPQCAVTNLDDEERDLSKYNRVYIPDGQIKDFAGSHLSKNYHWIFQIDGLGVVQSR